MKTVLIFGTFDGIHAGHLRLFRGAKRLGDRLVAVVARDTTVRAVKGRLPIHTEGERKELLSHIDYIDEALLGDLRDVYAVLRQVRPSVIALGYDQRTFVDQLEKAMAAQGISARVVRLRPYHSRRCKTSNMKQRYARTATNAYCDNE